MDSGSGDRSAPAREPAAAPRPAAQDVRVGPMAPLAGLLRELGHDPAPVFSAAGVMPDFFDDAERRVPYRSAAAVLAQAVRRSGRDDLGLLLGQRARLDQLGLLGELMRRARTVGEALHDLHRFFHLHDRGAVAYLRRRGHGTVALGYTVLDAEVPGMATVVDLALTIGSRLLRQLAGAGFAPQEVFLMRPAPRDPAAYRRCFGAPVGFDAAHSEIVFDARWLDRPTPGTDAGDRGGVQRVARSAEAAVGLRLADRAQAAALVLLAGGDVCAARLAEALGLHERTLRRRLAAEGSGCAAVIAAARRELAHQLLRETALPLAAVADALGYADAPAFVRAFRSWAGCTPGQWRAASRGGPARDQRGPTATAFGAMATGAAASALPPSAR